MRKKNGFTTKDNLVIICLSILIIAIIGLVVYANMNTTKEEPSKVEPTDDTPVIPDEPEVVTSVLNCSSISSENSNRNVFYQITFDTANNKIDTWDVTTLENYEEPLTEEELNEKVAEIENTRYMTSCINNSISTSLNVNCTLNQIGMTTYIRELGTTQTITEVQDALQTKGLSLNGEQVQFTCY